MKSVLVLRRAKSSWKHPELETFKRVKGYFDLIINTLAVEIDTAQYLNLLALDGTMVVEGIPEKETPVGH